MLARGGSQAPSYNSLSFSPVPPGLKMDMELFLKMKAKLRKWVKYMGLSDVSDGATEVMVYGFADNVSSNAQRMLCFTETTSIATTGHGTGNACEEHS
mmetsp:Transcript_45171/g.175280  ORF Transcript_45171/g.175280 Transcript_45171/m.175280 type:complete len:98 (+) Transcript_45171:2331-2624(+)